MYACIWYKKDTAVYYFDKATNEGKMGVGKENSKEKKEKERKKYEKKNETELFNGVYEFDAIEIYCTRLVTC